MNLKIKTEKDLWQYLCESEKKIVMYGMGNGADKILAVCEAKGIEVADFFASDGFVRGHLFHGKRVLSYSEAKERYGAENMIVLLSFASSLDDVIENILRIASECELYAPDVPVFGNTLFSMEFYNKNAEKFNNVYEMLEDNESKNIFENVVNYKLTGRIDFLEETLSSKEEVYGALLSSENIRSYADLGAYNGDTVRELSEYAPQLERVLALEPDRRNFKKLSLYAEGESRFSVRAENLAAWSRAETLLFDGGGNRNSNVSAGKKTVEVSAAALDDLLAGESVDYIKYDVEGSEREAIEGSARTIRELSPKLLVSVYHRSEDLFELPLKLREMNEKYRFYLRRYRYIPAWDLNLICIV
ncbi:MAG: FkbM family methyltransferase [Ruminococcaceae bacterium]|nr:FkbM family methyltransferase [Oscillospiraceae bacterium]